MRITALVFASVLAGHRPAPGQAPTPQPESRRLKTVTVPSLFKQNMNPPCVSSQERFPSVPCKKRELRDDLLHQAPFGGRLERGAAMYTRLILRIGAVRITSPVHEYARRGIGAFPRGPDEGLSRDFTGRKQVAQSTIVEAVDMAPGGIHLSATAAR